MTSKALLVPLSVLALLLGACLSIGSCAKNPVRSTMYEVYLDGGPLEWHAIEASSYTSKTSKLRGLAVRSIPDDLAEMLGIELGDVLLSVEDVPCLDRVACEQLVRGGIQDGAFKISTRWLSNGQVVERVYVRAVGG